MIKDKKILCTGGAGSIGSELVRQLAPKNEIYVLDIDETRMFDLVEELNIEGRVGDIRDKETITDTIDEFEPNIIFHSAALKHVTPSMWTPMEYIQTNIVGTYNFLRENLGVEKFINISTDKAVNPDNIMGATKKVSEILTKIYEGISVRFGNVMASRGSVLSIWEKQFKDNKPLTITNEKMERYFMTIPQACELVIKAAEIGEPGDVLIMDMGERKNIMDLKKELYGDYPYKIIGSRPGESLKEELMTEEEKKIAKKVDNFFVIKS